MDRPIFRVLNRETLDYLKQFEVEADKRRRLSIEMVAPYAVPEVADCINSVDPRLGYLLKRSAELNAEIVEYIERAYMTPAKENIG